MENEINKIKQEYLKTPTPKFLEEQGFSDVMGRILLEKQTRMIHCRQFALVATVIVVLLAGFTSLTVAAKPNTPLYQIKATTQKTFKSFIQPPTSKVDHTKINFAVPKLATPTPTLTPTPTKKPEAKPVKTKQKNNEKNEQITPQTHPSEDVKGLSTFKIPTPEPTHGNSNNSESQKNSDENSNSGKNDSNSQNHGSNQEKDK